VQGGGAEAWKDNLLDELAKGESEIETIEGLFTKIRNEFGETSKEKRKIEQLRTIEQGAKTCCQERVEWEQSGPEWSRITPEWKRVDNKSRGTTLASARTLCLDLLSRMWLHISGGLNCCQEF